VLHGVTGSHADPAREGGFGDPLRSNPSENMQLQIVAEPLVLLTCQLANKYKRVGWICGAREEGALEPCGFCKILTCVKSCAIAVINRCHYSLNYKSTETPSVICTVIQHLDSTHLIFRMLFHHFHFHLSHYLLLFTVPVEARNLTL